MWHWSTYEGRTCALQHEGRYLSNCLPRTTSRVTNAPARRRVFVELPPQDYHAGDEHMCWLLQCSLCGTRDATDNWEEGHAWTLNDLKLMRGIACPCVWQSCMKGKHIVATVHGDNMTIGGERSVVELLIKMVSRKSEIKKHVIGEDAYLEKSGIILNRVTGWGRDGIAIEADQRHVREILKDLELERANHSATPCAVERKNEGNARSNESEWEKRRHTGTDSHHERVDGISDGDDRDRPQMAGDDANDSLVLIGGDITKHRASCRTNQLLVTIPTRAQVRINASLLCEGKSICT